MTALRPAGDFDRTYEQDMSVIRRPWQWVALAVVLLLALTAPRWGSAYLVSTANHIFYTIIAVQGLNVLVGYTGQISLGQAAFMLVGGYTSALVTTHLGLPFPLAVLAPFLSLTIDAVDDALLQDTEARLLSLSEAISARYFLQYEKSESPERDNLLA